MRMQRADVYRGAPGIAFADWRERGERVSLVRKLGSRGGWLGSGPMGAWGLLRLNFATRGHKAGRIRQMIMDSKHQTPQDKRGTNLIDCSNKRLL